MGVFAAGGSAAALTTSAALDAELIRAEHEAFTSVYRGAEAVDVQVRAGETMASVLQRAGAPAADASAALGSVGIVYDARRMRPGDEISVYLAGGAGSGAPRLTGLAFRSGPGAAVTVSRSVDGAFTAREVRTPLTYEIARVAAPVETSIYEAAVARGATEQEIAEMAEVFGYDIDFQRDILRGDRFEMVFERFYDDQGATVRTGDMMFMSLESRRGLRTYYRFQAPGDTEPQWYDAEGRSARKFLMMTPINGARLSSGFGMRRHPIMGYSRMHQGTDFAAPTGTPIYAAGDGVIEVAGRRGGYGNYIRIQHNRDYETAYAHLSRFASGIRPGVRVRQGQVIGYVGSTGASTGPHLHYEVLVAGRQVNPMGLRVPTGRNLEADELIAFQVERARIDIIRESREQEQTLPQEASLRDRSRTFR
jgi:murein DD-endopeptidase MepM/ murein hydrolase activator NlpD